MFASVQPAALTLPSVVPGKPELIVRAGKESGFVYADNRSAGSVTASVYADGVSCPPEYSCRIAAVVVAKRLDPLKVC